MARRHIYSNLARDIQTKIPASVHQYYDSVRTGARSPIPYDAWPPGEETPEEADYRYDIGRTRVLIPFKAVDWQPQERDFRHHEMVESPGGTRREGEGCERGCGKFRMQWVRSFKGRKGRGKRVALRRENRAKKVKEGRVGKAVGRGKGKKRA